MDGFDHQPIRERLFDELFSVKGCQLCRFMGKVLLDCWNKEFTDVPKATSITPFELYIFNSPLYPPNGNSFGEYYYCTYVEGAKSLLRNPVRVYLNLISPQKIMVEDQNSFNSLRSTKFLSETFLVKQIVYQLRDLYLCSTSADLTAQSKWRRDKRDRNEAAYKRTRLDTGLDSLANRPPTPELFLLDPHFLDGGVRVEMTWCKFLCMITIFRYSRPY